MTREKVVAEKLLQIQAIKLNPQNPFTWTSGIKSPIYCDNRKVLSFPFIRDFIKSELCNLIFEKFEDAEVLAGVATAGIAWGAMASDQLKLPYIYVRSKPKEHGLGNQIEGYYARGQKVLVIEDLISTGKSSLEVINALKKVGLEVEGLVSIFTYHFPETLKTFEDAGIKCLSLTNYTTLIETAIEKQIVSADMQTILMEWKNNPRAWQGV
ncbi:MAG: orotate phosphoribosyltransferase [Chitinophagales bacterium]|nr:orotate phosphoribosyltransferase [Chitinophagales bacterium]